MASQYTLVCFLPSASPPLTWGIFLSALIGLLHSFQTGFFLWWFFALSQLCRAPLESLGVQLTPILQQLSIKLGCSPNAWQWPLGPFAIISIFTVLFTYLNTSSFWSQDVLKSLFTPRTYFISANYFYITWTIPAPGPAPAPPTLAEWDTLSNPSGPLPP